MHTGQRPPRTERGPAPAARAASGSTASGATPDSSTSRDDPWSTEGWSRGGLSLTPSKTSVVSMLVPELNIEPKHSTIHRPRRGSNEWWNDSDSTPSTSPRSAGNKRGGGANGGWNYPPKPPSAGKQRGHHMSSPTPHGSARSPQRMRGRTSPVPDGGRGTGVVPEYRHSVGENFS